MHFLLKQRKISLRVCGRLAAMSVLLAAVTLVSGCTGQKAKIQSGASSLVAETTINERLVQEDFAFPSHPPSLKRGKEVFQQHCVKCHAVGYWQQPKVKTNLAYTTPIDLYLMLTTGKAPEIVLPTRERKQLLPNHLAVKDQLSRDDRWAVIFYTRYLAGAGDMPKPNAQSPDIAAIFGGNCAVCHGSSGRADGPLFTGKTGNHELKDAELVHNFMPAPADFRQYNRMYNRTDAQIFKYICQGIYPSAMPSWYGNVDRDKETGKVVFTFDDPVIWSLVRYVRTLAYNNDLPPSAPEMLKPPVGLQALQPCEPVPQNRPWTNLMRESAPDKGQAYTVPAGNPITGGMILGAPNGHQAAHPVQSGEASRSHP